MIGIGTSFPASLTAGRRALMRARRQSRDKPQNLLRSLAFAATLVFGTAATSVAAGAGEEGENIRLTTKPSELVLPKDADLDPQTRSILDAVAKHGADITKLPVAEMRKSHESFFGPLGLPLTDITQIEEMRIPGPGGSIRLHVHRPRNVSTKLPVLIYYHGGGMNAGSLEQYDALCQRIAFRAHAIVVSVDYRLAPEFKFPVAYDDAYAALIWVSNNAASIGGDPSQLAVGGDSAGGNLAAAMAQAARDRKGPDLKFQLLIYPAVGTRGNSKSIHMFSKGYLFGAGELQWAYEQYLSDPRQVSDIRVSPILARDFRKLPPAFVISAGYEIMRDDIEEYADLLRSAGVPVELRRYEHTIHPFLSMAGVIDAGKTAIDDCADKLRMAFLPAIAPASKQ